MPAQMQVPTADKSMVEPMSLSCGRIEVTKLPPFRKPACPRPFNPAQAKRPVAREPHMPPHPCTPNTSKASSALKICLSLIAKKQMQETRMPIHKAPIGATKPQAGVIATSPATAPEPKPSAVGFL